MVFYINCGKCTTINSINDTKQQLCCVCFSELPKLTSIQLLNITEAEKKQKIINMNYMKAMEIMPELYTKSPSIYIKGSINGNMVKFLIDTGAQISLLSKSVAVACGLDKYIDERYSGELVGVGTDKILGKVHYTEITFDWGVLPCGFTICNNNNIIPIIGIDIMNSHGINIDFKTKTLQIGKNIIKWC
jgi:hypothetical protein